MSYLRDIFNTQALCVAQYINISSTTLRLLLNLTPWCDYMVHPYAVHSSKSLAGWMSCPVDCGSTRCRGEGFLAHMFNSRWPESCIIASVTKQTERESPMPRVTDGVLLYRLIACCCVEFIDCVKCTYAAGWFSL